jgi:hypothetical protein
MWTGVELVKIDAEGTEGGLLGGWVLSSDVESGRGGGEGIEIH